MVIFLLECLFVFFDLCIYLIIYRMIFGARYKKNALFSILILVGVSVLLEGISAITGGFITTAVITLLTGAIIPFLLIILLI